MGLAPALYTQESPDAPDTSVEVLTPPSSTTLPTAPPTPDTFFADVVVRGQPIFQVGSIGNLEAGDRAHIINRRIAGLLSQSRSLDPVTVQYDPTRQIAILQVNNRVIMTVTPQDALDYDQSAACLNRCAADYWHHLVSRTRRSPDWYPLGRANGGRSQHGNLNWAAVLWQCVGAGFDHRPLGFIF
ncbi:MAG: hypothetical protein IGR76_06235 [Synechococcales cyanobacterium T60_A2020_003]|nr:hypothetical protein [Synechococcales cyanobacterium T60_A2020_003]